MTKKERSLIIEAALRDFGVRSLERRAAQELHNEYVLDYARKVRAGKLKPRSFETSTNNLKTKFPSESSNPFRQ